MRKQNTIEVEGGPSLFDETPQAATVREDGNGLGDLFGDLNELRQMVEDTGFYFALPNTSLATKGELYFNNHIEQLRAVLDASGTPADVVNVVVDDYANTLFGSRLPKATPDQMKAALKAIKPYKAFSIDRYGLYWALLLNYSRCLNVLLNYQYDVTGVTATPESKKEFVNGFYSAADCRAVVWLAQIGELTPANFAGVYDPAAVASFLEHFAEFGKMYEYTAFYFIAKYALLATPQELDEITKPQVNSRKPIQEYAEETAAEAQQRLGGTADKYGVAFEAERTAEQEKTAEERARNWRDNVPLHETTNIICSMPVQVSPHGATIQNTMQIQQVIAGVTVANPGYGLITPMTVQKVFEGVNLLPVYFSPEIINDGKLKYNVSRSKFAEICGYQDANQNEKLALLGSLIMLSNLYIVVNRPIRNYEYKNMKGQTRRRTYGGRTAVQILNVPEFETDNNERITIIVTPEAFKGRPTFVTMTDYQRLKAEAKGLSQSRFNYQLLSKGHKAENDLLNEVFGYDEKLQLAADDPEALKRVKRSISNHRGRDMATVAAWFKDYQAKGIIKYKYNARTKVYTWDRVTPLTEQEQELLSRYEKTDGQ